MRGRKQKIRIRAYTRRQPAGFGYVGFEEIRVQKLQVRRWWGWQTVDEEIVPAHVWISIGTTGYDSGEWKSKFAKKYSFGRDGVITNG